MKKSFSVLAVILAAVLLLSGIAFAAGAEPVITPADGGTTAAFQAGFEKLDVTYRNDAIVSGGMYMIFVVTADADGRFIPTESSTLYVGMTQAVADDTVTFTDVYPSEITDSVVMISGTGLPGPVTVATIELPEDPVDAGDIDEDGDITSADAVALNKHLAGISELEGAQALAADIDGDGDITSADAVLLNKYLAGLIDKF